MTTRRLRSSGNSNCTPRALSTVPSPGNLHFGSHQDCPTIQEVEKSQSVEKLVRPDRAVPSDPEANSECSLLAQVGTEQEASQVDRSLAIAARSTPGHGEGCTRQ